MPRLAVAEEEPSPHLLTKKFLVKEIRVVGNTVLTGGEIKAEIAPYEGHEITLVILRQIAMSLTKLFQKKGYLLARAYVPPQDIRNGIVEIDVIEGRIGEIRIEGNHAYSTSFFQYFLKPTLTHGVLQSEQFEKALFILNEFPDLHVQSFLSPGKDPGTTDIIIHVSDKTPLHEVLDYNNFGNRFVGLNRLGFAVWHGNLTGGGDNLTLRQIYPFPSDENPFTEASYTRVISSSGAKLGVTWDDADIKVGQELQVLDIRGAATIYSVSLTQPLVRTSVQSSDISATFYYKNVRNFIFGGILTSRDKLRELALGYVKHWGGTQAKNFFDFTLTQGLGTWFGGMAPGDIQASRVAADDSFTKISSDFAHIQRIFSSDFIVLRGSTQYAFSPLSITEQFPLGGPDSVRGYAQSEFLGDSGWNLSAELRIPIVTSGGNSLQGAFFVDTGYATLRFPQVGETAKRHLTGAGYGVRASIGQDTSIRMDLGYPLDPVPNSTNERPMFYGQFMTQF